MRTTVTLAPDVIAELERLRREEGLGTSEAINFLVRRGMRPALEHRTYAPMSDTLGAKVDVANIAEVLDLLDDEGPDDLSRPDRPQGGSS
ncbi:MAG: ribbon-helix-helix protein, CopG family [Kineosporiaceae bacterium]